MLKRTSLDNSDAAIGGNLFCQENVSVDGAAEQERGPRFSWDDYDWCFTATFVHMLG